MVKADAERSAEYGRKFKEDPLRYAEQRQKLNERSRRDWTKPMTEEQMAHDRWLARAQQNL